MKDDKRLPLVALKDTVLFPGTTTSLYITREKSIEAINISVLEYDSTLLFVSQKKLDIEDPSLKDLYDIGVIGRITQVVTLPDNNIKILIHVMERIKLKNVVLNEEHFSSEYDVYPVNAVAHNNKTSDIFAEAVIVFAEYVRSNKNINPEVINSLNGQTNYEQLANLLASHSLFSVTDKQNLLSYNSVVTKVKKLIELMHHEISAMDVAHDINQKVKKQIEKTQRDYFLNEQIKIIQKELGEDDKSEIASIERCIKSNVMSQEATEKATSELKKLKSMNPISSEASIIRGYLDTLTGMPWKKFDKAKVDIKKAQKILDRDHYGLEKVKERIIEYLAVLQRSNKLKGPILCFMGPPGVGKTSLAKSIAEAVGRKYTKFALGGVRDEAEIRGHRRTYLGSMPGKIINLIKKAKTSNPLILLDEMDKMSSDFRGDPASALLEVLDPEQNSHFVDHYMEVEYDLSNTLFIATVNSLDLPRPLLDRMEVIKIHGYIEDEKMSIAKNHLIPKILKEHSVSSDEFMITDNATLDLIRFYTKESGVRSLEREISSVVRKVLKKIIAGDVKSIVIDSCDLEEYLGVRKYKYGVIAEQDQVGVTTGLVYTAVGGDLLSIEAVLVPGKGEIKMTGQLGDVMKESTQAAYSYFLSKLDEFKINRELLKTHDVHMHFPEGAISKDGPSAGIAIYTTILSLLSGVAVKKSVAMTGEITLLGKVLPIGGLREKLLAASRGGVKTVIIPEENIKDLKDIPDSIKSMLQILPVSNASEVVNIALTNSAAARL